jgi:hypothetical protein
MGPRRHEQIEAKSPAGVDREETERTERGGMTPLEHQTCLKEGDDRQRAQIQDAPPGQDGERLDISTEILWPKSQVGQELRVPTRSEGCGCSFANKKGQEEKRTVDDPTAGGVRPSYMRSDEEEQGKQPLQPWVWV